MNSLYRLVYTSVRTPKCDDSAIQSILASCERNNPGRQVTGVLVHSKKRFLQYIEGSQEEVYALYELIQRDDRHTAINQRNFEPIEMRIFPNWQMGYKNMDDQISFYKSIGEADQKIFEELIHGEIDFTNRGLKLLQLFFTV